MAIAFQLDDILEKGRQDVDQSWTLLKYFVLVESLTLAKSAVPNRCRRLWQVSARSLVSQWAFAAET
jgi:hypothetical protein